MKAQKGDKVKVDYVGSFDDGTIFDASSANGDHSRCLEFEVGAGQVIKGFDQAIEGMEKLKEKKVKLKPADAYGDYNSGLVHKIPRDKMPKNQAPKPGMVLMLGTSEGKKFPARIIKVDEKEVTIDLNHPLAGKTLNFKIKLMDIVPKGEAGKEDKHGPGCGCGEH